MAFSYCPHCGFKNMYSLQAPKFCGGCGKGLNILTAAKQTPAAPTAKNTAAPTRNARRRAAPLEEDDPEGLDIYEVPHISKLSYSIEKDSNKFNLKDIISVEEFQEFKEDPKPKDKKKKTRGRPRKN